MTVQLLHSSPAFPKSIYQVLEIKNHFVKVFCRPLLWCEILKAFQSVKNLQFATRWNWCWQINSNLLLVIKVQKLNNGAAGFLWRWAVCAAHGETEGWLHSSPPHTRPISFNQAERRAALSSGSLSSLSARSASITCTCAPLRIITWVQPLCRTAEELSRAALQHRLVPLYMVNTPINCLPQTADPCKYKSQWGSKDFLGF